MKGKKKLNAFQTSLSPKVREQPADEASAWARLKPVMPYGLLCISLSLEAMVLFYILTFVTFFAFLTRLEQSQQQLLAYTWQVQSSQQQFLRCLPGNTSAPLWISAGTAQQSCPLFCQSRISASSYLSLLWRNADRVFTPSGLLYKQISEHTDHQCTTLLNTVLLFQRWSLQHSTRGSQAHPLRCTCTYTHRLQLCRPHDTKQRDKHLY